MIKTFVLDTNVLLHSSGAIESFEDNHVVLPMAVIEELDKFKKKHDELGRNARQVIRYLDELRLNGKLKNGVKLENSSLGKASGTIQIMTGRGKIEDADLDLDVMDNKIIRVAYHLFKEGMNVIFVSKDINARVKADALGLEVMDFENQKVNFDELFSGCRDLKVDKKTIDKLHKNKTVSIPAQEKELMPNEFVLLRNETNSKYSTLARCASKNTLTTLNPDYDDHLWNIKARSKEQRIGFELLMDPDVHIVSLVGRAGTGKTLLALAAGLEQVVHSDLYDKILVSRPIIPMGKDIGFLPGDKEEKLSHWMQPIYDNLSFLMQPKSKGDPDHSPNKDVNELMKNNKIEIEALTYIRGRSIPRQYVIVDEAQNLTPHEVKTIVSRAGEGTKMILTGDPYQIDNPYLDSSSNGLSFSVEKLKQFPIHGHITLHKSERSPLAAVAAESL